VKIGVISDTHDYLDPRVQELFAGVDHILHAGDVGSTWITFQLEQIAPVAAVIGNTDSGISLKENEVIELGRHTFMVQHIVNPQTPDEKLRRLITKHRPDVLVFGHTHKAFDQTVNGTRFFNPGYSGKPKFNQPRSVAILHSDESGLSAELIPLG
jgi:putative phosphoesterase